MKAYHIPGHVTAYIQRDDFISLDDNPEKVISAEIIDDDTKNPIGKRLNVSYDKELEFSKITISPENKDWKNVKKINLKLSPFNYITLRDENSYESSREPNTFTLYTVEDLSNIE